MECRNKPLQQMQQIKFKGETMRIIEPDYEILTPIDGEWILQIIEKRQEHATNLKRISLKDQRKE